MSEWVTQTPDGLTLRISREKDSWIVSCDDGDEARSEVLDVALIEAIRGTWSSRIRGSVWAAHGFEPRLTGSSATFTR
jgi:hypothetical protein